LVQKDPGPSANHARGAHALSLVVPNLPASSGKARAIRFSTLDAICEALSCQPGDLLRFEPEHAARGRPAAASKRTASR